VTFSIATWNVNSLRVRIPHLTQWLEANPLDVVALQETKIADADFPVADLLALGWQSVFSGQRTYNGVALLSRQPAGDVVAGIPGFDDEQKRVLAATVGGVRVIDVYVPNGQAPGTEKFEYKLRWFEALRQYVAAELEQQP
jgi:exodeoxyribonuclease-3